MTRKYEREQQVAIAAVREAARLCQAVQRTIDASVLEKRDKSPVTVADFGSQALICRTLGEHFGDDPVIGEEAADELRRPENAPLLQKVSQHVQAILGDATASGVCGWIDRGGTKEHSDRYWTLDPIDGTKGFLRGEQYAIALALIVEGELTVAALGCPNLPAPGNAEPGVIFTAVRGEGAFAMPMNGGGTLPGAGPGPIHVSDVADPAAARFCESVESGHTSHDEAAQIARELGITKPPLRMDSQAKYAAVARGDAEVYLRLPTRADYIENIWDHAAGALVVTEAGGRVTDITGRPLEFTHGHGLRANRGVVAGNGRFHDKILAALAKLGVR